MVMVKLLYELQDVDSEISECHGLISSIDGQLGDRAELDILQRELEDQKASLHQLRLQQGSQELETESVRAKVRDVEGKLYGGSISNPRELEGYEREATLRRDQLQGLDDKLLEMMMSLETAQENLKSLEGGYEQAEGQWQTRQKELAKQRTGLEKTLGTLDVRRQGLGSRVGRQELALYEGLRQSRGGVAIAKVERGLCRGCRMALPTHQLQRARLGREAVQCNSCGRILFVS